MISQNLTSIAPGLLNFRPSSKAPIEETKDQSDFKSVCDYLNGLSLQDLTKTINLASCEDGEMEELLKLLICLLFAFYQNESQSQKPRNEREALINPPQKRIYGIIRFCPPSSETGNKSPRKTTICISRIVRSLSSSDQAVVRDAFEMAKEGKLQELVDILKETNPESSKGTIEYLSSPNQNVKSPRKTNANSPSSLIMNLRKKEQVIKALCKERAEDEEGISSLLKENEEAHKEIKTLKKKAQDNEVIIKQFWLQSSNFNELEDLRTRVEALSKENEINQKKITELARFKQDNLILVAENESLRDSMKSLEEKYDKVESKVKNQEELNKVIQHLQEKTETLESELRQSQLQVTYEREQADELRNAVESYKEQLADTTVSNMDSSGELVSMVCSPFKGPTASDMQNLEEQINQLSSELSDQKTLREMEKMDFESQKEQLVSELKRVQSALEGSISHISSFIFSPNVGPELIPAASKLQPPSHWFLKLKTYVSALELEKQKWIAIEGRYLMSQKQLELLKQSEQEVEDNLKTLQEDINVYEQQTLREIEAKVGEFKKYLDEKTQTLELQLVVNENLKTELNKTLYKYEQESLQVKDEIPKARELYEIVKEKDNEILNLKELLRQAKSLDLQKSSVFSEKEAKILEQCRTILSLQTNLIERQNEIMSLNEKRSDASFIDKMLLHTEVLLGKLKIMTQDRHNFERICQKLNEKLEAEVQAQVDLEKQIKSLQKKLDTQDMQIGVLQHENDNLKTELKLEKAEKLSIWKQLEEQDAPANPIKTERQLRSRKLSSSPTPPETVGNANRTRSRAATATTATTNGQTEAYTETGPLNKLPKMSFDKLEPIMTRAAHRRSLPNDDFQIASRKSLLQSSSVAVSTSKYKPEAAATSSRYKMEPPSTVTSLRYKSSSVSSSRSKPSYDSTSSSATTKKRPLQDHKQCKVQ